MYRERITTSPKAKLEDADLEDENTATPKKDTDNFVRNAAASSSLSHSNARGNQIPTVATRCHTHTVPIDRTDPGDDTRTQ